MYKYGNGSIWIKLPVFLTWCGSHHSNSEEILLTLKYELKLVSTRSKLNFIHSLKKLTSLLEYYNQMILNSVSNIPLSPIHRYCNRLIRIKKKLRLSTLTNSITSNSYMKTRGKNVHWYLNTPDNSTTVVVWKNTKFECGFPMDFQL